MDTGVPLGSGRTALAFLLAAACLWAAIRVGAASWLDLAFFDLRAGLTTRAASGEIVVVGIDAESLAELDLWPWPRRLHATLIRKLHAAGVERLAVDIDFGTPSDPEDDARLREALALFGPGRVAVPAIHREAAGGRAAPANDFTGVATETAVSMLPDPDGKVRRFPARHRVGPRDLEAMSVWLAGRRPAAGVFHPDFTIDPATFPYIGYADLLFGRIPAETLRGRLVLLGAIDLALGDRAAVPRYRLLPGVVLQAIAAESLLQGRTPPPRGVGALPPYALLFALMLIWTRLSPPFAAPLGILVPAAIEAVAIAAQLAGIASFATGGLHLAAAIAFTIGVPLRTRAFERASRLATSGLRRERAFRTRFLEISLDPILVFDALGRVLEANPAAISLFGRQIRKLSGLLKRDQLTPVLALVESGGRLRFECTLPAAGGEHRTLEALAWSAPEETGAVGVLQLRDVSERTAFVERLRFLARHDPLTGLAVRSALLEDLGGAREPFRGALVLLEIDRFADFNAAVGVDAADRVLVELADLLRAELEDGESAYRTGSAQFALVVAGREPERIAARLRRILEVVRHAGSVAGADIRLRAGIAPAEGTEGEAPDLLRRAQSALADARSRGVRLAVYDPEVDARGRRRMQLETALAAAVRTAQLAVRFQPQASIRDGTIRGCEALVRWSHAEFGEVSPAVFVPAAERSGLVDAMTEVVLKRALDAQRWWHEVGIDLPVSVNLSPVTLRRPAAIRNLVRIAAGSVLGAGAVTLEVTESAVVGDMGAARELLGEIRAAGVRVAIDDFGTGQSSFAYLGTLPADELKLDRAFVRELPHNASACAIVSSVIELAHRIGLSVVVEGVETEKQRAFLAGLGHDLLIQGYLVGRPCDARELTAHVRGGDPAAAAVAPLAAHTPATHLDREHRTDVAAAD